MPVISSGGGLWTEITDGADLVVGGVNMARIKKVTTNGFIYGSQTSGHGLYLYANTAQQYARIHLGGNSDVKLYAASGQDIQFYHSTTEFARLVGTNYHLALKEAAASPADIADYGQIYTKADNLLYFRDGAGVEHVVAFV
jgi:hypothetical protein